MKTCTFSYSQSCLVDKKTLDQTIKDKDVSHIINVMREAFSQEYATDYASLAIPFDKKMMCNVLQMVQEKKKLCPKVLIVIGIGGSNLGMQAVHEAVLGRFYNTGASALKVYFLDTIDSDQAAQVLTVIRSELEAQRPVVVNVITKSGSTTETLINFSAVLGLLKQFNPTGYQEQVVVTTDAQSPLWHMALSEGFSLLEIPKKVGGRYSVFTAVGLFPLALCGVDVEQLVEGAQLAVRKGLSDSLEENDSLVAALLLYLHYRNGIAIHDTFLFSLDFEGVGKWYRQLLAESIGKEFNTKGQQVMVGITPTVSVGSIDLHSVAQLYLAGPRDKFTTFVTVQKNKNSLVISNEGLSIKGLSECTGKTFEHVMDALLKGTQAAYLESKRPFSTIKISEKSEYCLGQLLQSKMIEVMYLGYLLEINPFDQPNVELYKKEAQKILGS